MHRPDRPLPPYPDRRLSLATLLAGSLLAWAAAIALGYVLARLCLAVIL
jgi:hypothetical protein